MGIKMEIVLKRKLTNEMMTTYLPSFLLILITYATTYFKPFYFEAALTLSLSIIDLQSICSLSKLKVLIFSGARLEEAPHCMAHLKALRILDLSGNEFLSLISLAVFQLPNLAMLTLADSALSIDGLLIYNAPEDIDRKSALTVRTFFEEKFKLNEYTEYYPQN